MGRSRTITALIAFQARLAFESPLVWILLGLWVLFLVLWIVAVRSVGGEELARPFALVPEGLVLVSLAGVWAGSEQMRLSRWTGRILFGPEFFLGASVVGRLAPAALASLLYFAVRLWVGLPLAGGFSAQGQYWVVMLGIAAWAALGSTWLPGWGNVALVIGLQIAALDRFLDWSMAGRLTPARATLLAVVSPFVWGETPWPGAKWWGPLLVAIPLFGIAAWRVRRAPL